MSRRLSRISLALFVLLSSKLWALGLGEIKLDSALNEPLRAEIELLSATTEELAGLRIDMASAETFDRYGLDRPVYLQNIQFQIRHSGRADGNVVEIRSVNPVTEPFVTFLVEASWARGRLLREYTLLLDPPTFVLAAAASSTPAVTAPKRSTPADSGRIEQPAAAAAVRAPDPEPARTSPVQMAPPPVVDDQPYDAAAGDGYQVARSETLWGIASRTRPDSRLTMNQTMLAIFKANPEAFGGNINILHAGPSLRIPSADEIHQIGRNDALDEVQRQHAAWNPGYQPVPAPSVADTTPQNELTLVPPDDDYLSDAATDDAYDDAVGDEELSREQEVERRIFELENADVPVQRSLIEIRDNELAALRAELAQIRVEVYEPESDDPFADDETSGEPVADPDADDTVVETTPEPEPVVRPARQSKPGLVEQILDVLSSWWIPIAGVLVVVGGLLFWFMRRGSGDDDELSTWRSLDADDVQRGDLSATESMRAPKIEDSSSLDETGEMPAIAATDFDLDLDDLTAALEVSEIGDTIEQMRDDATVEQRRPRMQGDDDDWSPTLVLEPGEMSDDLHDARTMTEVGTKLDLARAYVDMGDPSGARSILEEVLDEGDAAQRQQAQQLLDSLPS